MSENEVYMDAGTIGGVIGGVLGVAGGILGTYFSIVNTESPREKQFMIKASAYIWLGIILFLLLLFAIPYPYRWFVWVPYGILLPLGIRAINNGVQRIREEEANKKE